MIIIGLSGGGDACVLYSMSHIMFRRLVLVGGPGGIAAIRVEYISEGGMETGRDETRRTYRLRHKCSVQPSLCVNSEL